MKCIRKKITALAIAAMMLATSFTPSVFADSLNDEDVSQYIGEISIEEVANEDEGLAIESRLNEAYAKQTTSVTYMAGQDRYQTAVKVSQQGWPDGSDIVILANSRQALGGIIATPLATSFNAPILVTPNEKLNQDTMKELQRLKPKTIYMIGDESHISKDVSNKVKEVTDATMLRIGGKYAGEISLNVAKNIEKNKKVETAYVVSATNGIVDALTIADKAGQDKAPILVISKDQMHPGIYTFLKENINKVYFVGGTNSISDDNVAKIRGVVKDAGPSNRVAGEDRHSTNVNVINKFYEKQDLENIVVTKSENRSLIDNVAAGPFAVKHNAPILITDKNKLAKDSAELLDQRIADKVYQIGGGISTAVTAQITKKLGEVKGNIPTPNPNPNPTPEPNPNPKPSTSGLSGKTIIIDPGHGGKDNGAGGLHGIKEKDWTLKTSLACADYLASKGANVIMTRKTDVYPTLPDRTNLSNAKNADFFCSIHYNKGGNVVNASTGELSGTGVEVFKGEGDFAYSAASNVLKSILEGFNLRNRGVKDGTHLYVIRNTVAPAILVEGGFLSNSKDVSLLGSDAAQKKIGIQIAKGIEKTFK